MVDCSIRHPESPARSAMARIRFISALMKVAVRTKKIALDCVPNTSWIKYTHVPRCPKHRALRRQVCCCCRRWHWFRFAEYTGFLPSRSLLVHLQTQNGCVPVVRDFVEVRPRDEVVPVSHGLALFVPSPQSVDIDQQDPDFFYSSNWRGC